MMKRYEISNFYISKKHSIEYYELNYFKSIINRYIRENKNSKTEKWNNKIKRIYIIKNYFKEFKTNNVMDCLNYFKEKLKNIKISEEDKDLIVEIKTCKNIISYKFKTQYNIILKLRNLKVNEGNIIIKEYTYEHLNKITKNLETLSMRFILNKKMTEQIRDKNKKQFFGDETFRYVPPKFRRYRLYIISAFNLLIKYTRIISYILIPNETFVTYKKWSFFKK